jgi:hypothetical protein
MRLNEAKCRVQRGSRDRVILKEFAKGPTPWQDAQLDGGELKRLRWLQEILVRQRRRTVASSAGDLPQGFFLSCLKLGAAERKERLVPKTGNPHRIGPAEAAAAATVGKSAWICACKICIQEIVKAPPRKDKCRSIEWSPASH